MRYNSLYWDSGKETGNHGVTICYIGMVEKNSNYCIIIGHIGIMGTENGSYCINRLCWDNGKENGNYCVIEGYIAAFAECLSCACVNSDFLHMRP